MDEATVRMAANMWALVAEMNAEVCDATGMRAENQARLAEGEALAFDDSNFARCADELRKLADRLRTEI